MPPYNDWLGFCATRLDNKVRIMSVVRIEPSWWVVEPLADVLLATASARLRNNRREWRTGDDKRIVRGITRRCELSDNFH